MGTAMVSPNYGTGLHGGTLAASGGAGEVDRADRAAAAELVGAVQAISSRIVSRVADVAEDGATGRIVHTHCESPSVCQVGSVTLPLVLGLSRNLWITFLAEIGQGTTQNAP